MTPGTPRSSIEALIAALTFVKHFPFQTPL